MEYPSKLVEETVEHFAQLPGIGKKTALRLVLHLLKQDENDNNAFGDAIQRLATDIQYCKVCHSIAEAELCPVCSSNNRDHQTVCVVEDIRDVMAIENTNQYNGVYHVLGGVISPMDGAGPENLTINSLVKRVQRNGVQELIFALNSTMEGDTTMFYISKQLKYTNVRVSSISRGIAIGAELEYTDDVTLARSIAERTPYNNQ